MEHCAIRVRYGAVLKSSKSRAIPGKKRAFSRILVGIDLLRAPAVHHFLNSATRTAAELFYKITLDRIDEAEIVRKIGRLILIKRASF
jgi:hypothetical protein